MSHDDCWEGIDHKHFAFVSGPCSWEQALDIKSRFATLLGSKAYKGLAYPGREVATSLVADGRWHG